MKVRTVMVESPVSCSPDTNLGAVAEMMWNNNCGFVPIVSSEQNVVGVLTDRDMCIAMATRSQSAGEITAQQASSGNVHSCQVEDEISSALETMSDKGVRRLPVVNNTGKLAGILSLDDIVLKVESKGNGPLSSKVLLQTLKAVCNAQRRAQKKAASA
jgi:CBS domain-containing protein